jgi:hypothetical protein
VSRFRHPVAGADLLRSPEFRLRHPAERQQPERESCYDEGAGCGFDGLSPDAYAERWTEVAAGAAQVMTWYAQQFAALGWRPNEPIPASGVAHLTFQRDPGERLGVLMHGKGEWWKDPGRLVKWDSGNNLLRVHLAVDGVFPDGRPGIRAG